MTEFPSNSHESKQQQKPKVEKVITGVATTKKKSEATKFAEVFIAEDISNVKNYVIVDVLIPAIKKAINDIVSNGIEMILYGENGSPSASKKSISSKISYTPYYKMSSGSQKEISAPKPKSVYEYDTIILDNRADAERLLMGMDEHIRAYGMISIADYYDMAEVSSEHTTNKYGWTDLREAKVVRIREGYTIKLPRPYPLD